MSALRIRWTRGFRYCWIENVCFVDFRPEYRTPAETEPEHAQ